MFPNTPYLRKCIAMDKLFTVWRKQNNRKKKNNNKKKEPRIVPFGKDVRVYIYIFKTQHGYVYFPGIDK